MIRIGHCHLRPMDWPSYASIASRTPQSPDQQRAVLVRNVLDAPVEDDLTVFSICERMLIQHLQDEGYEVRYVDRRIDHQVVYVRIVDGWLKIDPQTGEVIKC